MLNTGLTVIRGISPIGAPISRPSRLGYLTSRAGCHQKKKAFTHAGMKKGLEWVSCAKNFFGRLKKCLTKE